MRYTGQIQPYIPPSAPLSYQLPEMVYAMGGTCSCNHGMGNYGDSKLPLVLGLAAVALGVYFFAKK